MAEEYSELPGSADSAAATTAIPMDSGSSNASQGSNDAVTQTPVTQDTTVAEALKHFSGDFAEEFRVDNTDKSNVPTQQITSQPNPPAKTRIFDGLDDSEKEHFSRMSTAAYEYLYPRHIKSKQQETEFNELRKTLEQNKDSSFYLQDGAWKLSPEYNNLSGAINRFQQEAGFWEEQLALLEDGKPCKALGRDQAGNLFIGDLPEGPQSKAKVLGALMEAKRLYGSYSDRLEQYEMGFKQKHSTFVDNIKATRSNILKGLDTTQLEKLAAKKMENFPPYVRNNVEYKMIGELLVVVDALAAQLKQAKQSSDVAAIKNKTASNNPIARPAASSSGNSDNVGNILKQQFGIDGY